jgi:hypothetical protein
LGTRTILEAVIYLDQEDLRGANRKG